jgi:sulfur-carrier protein
MTVTVRYFAAIREALGASEQLALADLAAAATSVDAAVPTVGHIRQALMARSAAHASALGPGRAVRMALNQVMCDETTPVEPGAEVAFFPPVTGG